MNPTYISTVLVTNGRTIFEQLVNTNFFNQYGLITLFIFAVIPSFIPLQLEIAIIPLLSTGITPTAIIVVSTLGTFIGKYILYVAGKYGYKKITKNENQKAMETKHLIHKYRYLWFFVSQFVYILGDLIVVYAGVKHMKFESFALPLFIGNLGSSIMLVLVAQGIVMLPFLH